MSLSSERHPLDQGTSCLARLSMLWMEPLLALGFKRPLLEADVWPLPEDCSAQNTMTLFQNAWDAQLAKSKKDGGSPSLLGAFYAAFGWRWKYIVAFLTVFNLCVQAAPFLVGRLLQCLVEGALVCPSDEGYGYAVGIWGCFVCISFCVTNYRFLVTQLGSTARLASILTGTALSPPLCLPSTKPPSSQSTRELFAFPKA